MLIILLNAGFAFVQEVQAERAVEALAAYLPQRAKAVRDGVRVRGRRRATGARRRRRDRGRRPGLPPTPGCMDGAIEVDLSALTGESVPALPVGGLPGCRRAAVAGPRPGLQRHDLHRGRGARRWCSPPGCTPNWAVSPPCRSGSSSEPSPLERQVRRVAWLIAAGRGARWRWPSSRSAVCGAGLSLKTPSVIFAVGLLVGNVPEGLLPVITLALALGVRGLAAPRRRGQAAERGGDPRLHRRDLHRQDRHPHREPHAVEHRVDDRGGDRLWTPPSETVPGACRSCGRRCAAGRWRPAPPPSLDAESGDERRPHRTGAARSWPPMLGAARRRPTATGAAVASSTSTATQADVDHRRARSTAAWVHTKGAPEAVMPRCTTSLTEDGRPCPLTTAGRARRHGAGRCLRAPTGCACSPSARAHACRPEQRLPEDRADAETRADLLGLVAMLDPPRPEVAAAVADCRTAGIRIIVITGDHALTAAAIARQRRHQPASTRGHHRRANSTG